MVHWQLCLKHAHEQCQQKAGTYFTLLMVVTLEGQAFLCFSAFFKLLSKHILLLSMILIHCNGFRMLAS